MSFERDTTERLHDMLRRGDDFFLFRAPGARAQFLNLGEVSFSLWPGESPRSDVWSGSTDRADYLERVGVLTGQLRRRGGKTVISRTVAGTALRTDLVQLVSDFFDTYPQAYRTFFIDHRYGGWLGASPELLFSIDRGRLHTMALAGTRAADLTGPWDDKNICEHMMVADFIDSCLDACGTSHIRSERGELQYGSISHLLTRFESTVPGDLGRFKALMFPTPAVGGLPRGRALADIAAIEQHPRQLYAGLIDLTDPADGRRYCIVNLRCMHFNITGPADPAALSGKYNLQYCIYAGGGITGDSDPAAEWDETEQKSRRLRDCIAANQTHYGLNC